MTRVGKCPPSNLKKKKLVGIYNIKKYRSVKIAHPQFCFKSLSTLKKNIKEDKSINNYIKYPKQSKIIIFTTTQITQKKPIIS